MIKDKGIAWNRKRKFYPCFNMLGVIADATEGAGAPVFAALALAASELVGLQMAAAGDEIYTFIPVPWDLDPAYPIRGRIWFIHNSTDADDPDWVVTLKGIGYQDAITDAKSSPDETLTFAAKVVSTTNNSLELTDWVKSTSEATIVSTDRALLVSIECNGLGSAAANEIELLGLELEWTVGATKDSNHRDTTVAAPIAAD